MKCNQLQRIQVNTQTPEMRKMPIGIDMLLTSLRYTFI